MKKINKVIFVTLAVMVTINTVCIFAENAKRRPIIIRKHDQIQPKPSDYQSCICRKPSSSNLEYSDGSSPDSTVLQCTCRSAGSSAYPSPDRMLDTDGASPSPVSNGKLSNGDAYSNENCAKFSSDSPSPLPLTAEQIAYLENFYSDWHWQRPGFCESRSTSSSPTRRNRIVRFLPTCEELVEQALNGDQAALDQITTLRDDITPTYLFDFFCNFLGLEDIDSIKFKKIAFKVPRKIELIVTLTEKMLGEEMTIKLINKINVKLSQSGARALLEYAMYYELRDLFEIVLPRQHWIQVQSAIRFASEQPHLSITAELNKTSVTHCFLKS